MNSKLALITTRNFGGMTLNCYGKTGQESNGDFWATREQIGQFLGYANPRKAIKILHLRNKERLDNFSRGVQVESPQGGTQTATVYNFKGLLEICRFSNQPNANKVIDILWDVADEIRRTGMYITEQAISRLKKRVAVLEKEASDSYPLRLLGEIVLARPESIPFQSAAQFLCQHGINIGPNRLYKYCRNIKLLCSRKGRMYNRPTQRAIEAGIFNLEIRDGFNPSTMVTPKGLSLLAERLTAEQYPLLMAMGAEETQAGGNILCLE